MSDAPIQTVTLAGEDYAVVPLAEYEALRNAVNEDAMDAAIMKRVLEDPDRELVPFTLVKRIADGEHPVRVWRAYRGMRAGELAIAAGIASSYLSDIENGKKPGSINAMKRIAIALDVTIDDCSATRRCRTAADRLTSRARSETRGPIPVNGS